MLTRSTFEMKFRSSRDPQPTIEVDSDSLHATGLDLDDVAAKALSRFAAANPKEKATIYLYGSESVTFRTPTWSEFLIVVGSEKVLTLLGKSFGAVPNVRSRFSDYIQPRPGLARYHIEDGQCWQVLDAASWMLVEPESAAAPAADENEADDPLPEEFEESDESDELSLEDEGDNEWADEDWGEDQLTDDITLQQQKPVKQGRLRAARSDARVGTIRETIEELFGLPPGSVALCGPDRRPLRADASIATLRRRWEDA